LVHICTNRFFLSIGLSCIKHLLTNISKKFDQSLRSICIDNLQHALLLTSLPTEYLIYEFLVSSPDDLLQNVRVYIQNDSNSSISSSYGIANGDSSIFPLCQQIFNEHEQQQEQKIIEGKLFRFTFRTINDADPHEIQMKTFVYLNYFHLQLIHIIGELNWSELIPCLSQTIDLAERFDSTISNFGLRHILQQLFAFDPPAVTFQHVKRIAFQYLVDYLMHGVKNELVKQSIESANLNSQQVELIDEIIEFEFCFRKMMNKLLKILMNISHFQRHHHLSNKSLEILRKKQDFLLNLLYVLLILHTILLIY